MIFGIADRTIICVSRYTARANVANLLLVLSRFAVDFPSYFLLCVMVVATGLFVNEVLTSFHCLSFERTCDLQARCYFQSQECQHPVLLAKRSDLSTKRPSSSAACSIPFRPTHILSDASPILVHAEASPFVSGVSSLTPISERVLSSSTPLCEQEHTSHSVDAVALASLETMDEESTSAFGSARRAIHRTPGNDFIQVVTPGTSASRPALCRSDLHQESRFSLAE